MNQIMKVGCAGILALSLIQPAMAKKDRDDDDDDDDRGRGRHSEKHKNKAKFQNNKAHYKYEYRDESCRYKYEYNYKSGKTKIDQRGDCSAIAAARPVMHGGEPLPRAIPPEPQARRMECNRDVLGAVIGGAIGAVVGNKVSESRDRTVMTVGGAVIGAVVGGAIGRSMDDADQACAAQALEYASLKQSVTWENKARGASYTVTPTEIVPAKNGECRKYVLRATGAGQPQNTTGVACRQPNGAWAVTT